MKKIIIKSVIISFLIIINVLSINLLFMDNTDNTNIDDIKNYGIDRNERYNTTLNGNKAHFAEDKIVDEILFQQTSYVYNPNTNIGGFEIFITNTSKEVYRLEGFKVIIKDEDGKKLTSLDLDFRVDLEQGVNYNYNFEVDGDKVGVGRFELEYVPKEVKS